MFIVWIETDENRLHSICSASKNIGRVLREYVWETSSSFVLTSGTMSDGVDFSFFEKENGIHQIAKMFRQTSMTASPFDYKNHTRRYMPKGIPLPENNSPEYIAAISDEIVKIVKATNGHAAILFTSYKVLEAVYRQTKDRLTQYELIRMTRSNKSAIADFKKSKNGVLFASGSMWEGVDCIGDCLSSVIIPRLPFPMRSATMESKKEECNGLGDFVNTICVPEMLIKLRQGLGRLIRCETDTGLISSALDVALEEFKTLQARLDEIDEPLDSFDPKLFEEVINGMTVNNRDEMTFRLIGDLTFTVRL